MSIGVCEHCGKKHWKGYWVYHPSSGEPVKEVIQSAIEKAEEGTDKIGIQIPDGFDSVVLISSETDLEGMATFISNRLIHGGSHEFF